jgi:hypothetical protein
MQHFDFSLFGLLQKKENESHRSHSEKAQTKEITYGRRFARYMSKNKILAKFYNPSSLVHQSGGQNKEGKDTEKDHEKQTFSVQDEETKCLDTGWEYFEHYVLPRCHAEKFENKNGRKYIRVKPGSSNNDEKTMLYPVWGTPLQDMGDFGIGVGMYFDMLRYYGLVALFVAFISIPALAFYASNEYSPDGKEGIVNPVNKASAICTNTYWVPCPNCTKDDFNTWPASLDDSERVLRITAPFPNQDKEVVFMLRNGCELNETFSIVTLAGVIFFCLSTFIFLIRQKNIMVMLDEGEQTTSDYSIRIKVSKKTKKTKIFIINII